MVLDASDQVAELRALDTPPFALDFRRAMCTVPPVSGPPDKGIAARYASIINEVDKIVAMYSGPTHADLKRQSRRASSALPNAATVLLSILLLKTMDLLSQSDLPSTPKSTRTQMC